MAQQKSIAFFERLTAAIIRFRWAALAGTLLLTAFFLTQASKLKFNGSYAIWFFEDDPAMQRLRAFKEAFGNDQFVYILAETDGVFTADAAGRLKRLAQELEARTPFLRDLNWVGNAEHIAAQGDAVAIHKLLDDIPADRRELDRRLALALSEKDFVDRYISADGKAAGILLELERFPEGRMTPPPSEQVARAVLAVTAMPEFSGMRLHVVGDPIFETRYNDVANSETPKFFGLCLLVQAVLFYLSRGGKLILRQLGGRAIAKAGPGVSAVATSFCRAGWADVLRPWPRGCRALNTDLCRAVGGPGDGQSWDGPGKQIDRPSLPRGHGLLSPNFTTHTLILGDRWGTNRTKRKRVYSFSTVNP
jgi:hypothetical protein